MIGNAPVSNPPLITGNGVGVITDGTSCTNGGTLTFNLGNVQNLDNDADFEYIEIQFNALVCNDVVNQDTAPPLPNSFSISEDLSEQQSNSYFQCY